MIDGIYNGWRKKRSIMLPYKSSHYEKKCYVHEIKECLTNVDTIGAHVLGVKKMQIHVLKWLDDGELLVQTKRPR